MKHPIFLAMLTFAALLAGCARNSRFTYDHEGIVRGDVSRPVLALVFTGGSYGEGSTHILDVLDRMDIRASFFVTGDFLASPARREYVRRMVAEGHYVGPHSHAHLLYCPWEDRERTLVTKDEFTSDLLRNVKDLRELGACGGRPIYFIPPFEWYNVDQAAWARELGIVLFNFTPGSGSNRDWIPEDDPKFTSSARILQDILAYERKDPHGLNGFILLLHLGSQRQDKMHEQLEPLLQALRERGYRFVRIDELLGHE